MVDGVNGKGNNLEVLFGGLSGNESAKQANEQTQSSKVAAYAQATNSSAVKISVGEDKTARVETLKAAYAAGGDSALSSLHSSEAVAKSILG